MEKLLVLIPFDEAYRERVRSVAGDACEVVFAEPKRERAAYLAHLAEATLLLGDPAPADLAHCEALKMMQTTWAGVEQYVGAPCFSAGAVLCNMSGAYGPQIAEYALGMILALCRRFPAYVTNQQSGTWKRMGASKQLEGATVLILGAGDIGVSLAKLLRPFGTRIVGVRRVPRETPPEFERMITLDELDELLPLADVVACSLPETPQTHHLLDAKRLRRMKEDAVLVNVGRGGLIASDDLAAVMAEGRFFGVGLDVTEPEPLPADHPLWRQERLFVTPHVSGGDFGAGTAAARRIWDICLRNLENYLCGRPLENVVNLETGYRRLS